MSVKKQYFKSKPQCKVTFRLPAKLVGSAKTAAVVGEFNNWDPKGIPMMKLKDGSFKTTLELNANNSYQFRYFIDNNRWENEPHADHFVPNHFSGDNNSVIDV